MRDKKSKRIISYIYFALMAVFFAASCVLVWKLISFPFAPQEDIRFVSGTMLDFQCDKDLAGESAKVIAEISGESVLLENPSYACNYYGSEISSLKGSALKAGLGVESGTLKYLEVNEEVFVSIEGVEKTNLIGVIFTLVFTIAMTLSIWLSLRKVSVG